MPGVVQHSLDSPARVRWRMPRPPASAASCSSACPRCATPAAPGPTDPDGILNVATPASPPRSGDALVVQTDLCLDEFTDHGHCGVLDARGARRQRRDPRALRRDGARAGARRVGSCSASSGMMDGQVAAVREALDADGLHRHRDPRLLGQVRRRRSTARSARRSSRTLEGDRRTYQLDPGNRREGVREALLDIDEGADIVMVKPALQLPRRARRRRAPQSTFPCGHTRSPASTR